MVIQSSKEDVEILALLNDLLQEKSTEDLVEDQGEGSREVLVVRLRSAQTFIIRVLAGRNSANPLMLALQDIDTRLRELFPILTIGAIERGPFRLSLQSGGEEIHFHGRRLRLSPLEFRVLRLFVKNSDRVVSYAEIYRDAWTGKEHFSRGSISEIKSTVASLRKKLKRVDQRREGRFCFAIVNFSEFGYRLVVS